MTPAEDPTELLRSVAAGRPGAWAELVERYSPLLEARTRRYRLQEADAHDVVQTTWLRLAENLDRIHTPAHLAGWLSAVTSHECQRVVRDHRRTVATEEPGFPTTDSVDGPEQAAVDGDVRRVLQDALADLPPRRRALLVALFAEERRSYAEIAREHGLPIGSIGPTRARLLMLLRRSLAHSGIAA